MYPKLPFMFLPYTRLELPKTWHLLNKLNVCVPISDDRWETAPNKIIKGKWHGYRMSLNLSDWSERMTFFLGRYYEIDMQLLLKAVLSAGDRFIDIGANIGMISLHAAHLVTDRGLVECFEPNPECLIRLRQHIDMNAIKHMKVYPVGLSNEESTLTLNLSSSHSGTATFAAIKGNEVTKSFEVKTLVGDDVLLENTKTAKLIKIDVEGFEFNVLQGLEAVLEQMHPLVVMEMDDKLLKRAGSSTSEIEGFLRQRGYQPFGLKVFRKGFKRHIQFIPIEQNAIHSQCENILWKHENSTLNGV